MTNKLDNSNISKHLGKSSEYACIYDPSLLVKEPRQNNRTHLGIVDDNLPFVGSDTWNGYEFTALMNNGLPVVGIVKLVYPSSSKYIVESKSLKLYFNSFSMTKLGHTREAVFAEVTKLATNDLEALLECTVDVSIFTNEDILNDPASPNEEWDHSTSSTERYATIEDEYYLDKEKFIKYVETPDLLKFIDKGTATEVRYHSGLLRSRCRVTSQPDSGDVYIYIKGVRVPEPVDLLKYIVSFRDECHFHEEICEAIYKRLYDVLDPEELCVRCLYARRGGWDICPERATSDKLLHPNLSDSSFTHIKTPKQ